MQSSCFGPVHEPHEAWHLVQVYEPIVSVQNSFPAHGDSGRAHSFSSVEDKSTGVSRLVGCWQLLRGEEAALLPLRGLVVLASGASPARLKEPVLHSHNSPTHPRPSMNDQPETQSAHFSGPGPSQPSLHDSWHSVVNQE